MIDESLHFHTIPIIWYSTKWNCLINVLFMWKTKLTKTKQLKRIFPTLITQHNIFLCGGKLFSLEYKTYLWLVSIWLLCCYICLHVDTFPRKINRFLYNYPTTVHCFIENMFNFSIYIFFWCGTQEFLFNFPSKVEKVKQRIEIG